MPGYVRPIPYPDDKWRSTFRAHTLRSPRSSEAGVDYYCPIGTTLYSLGDGYVAEVGGSITQATGRFVKVNLDDGRSFRYLHLGPRHSLKARGQRVKKGEPLAISGASGYGSEFFGASSVAGIPTNTGGPHTHATLWPTYDMRFGYRPDGTPYTLDLELYIDRGIGAGDGSTPFPEEDDMPLNASDKQMIKDAIFEVLRDVKLGPGGRNFWDSQQFQADLTAGVDAKVGAQQQALNSQGVKDALIGALTDWRVFDGGRNVFDQLKFIADSGQGPVELSASLEAIAKAVRAEFKTDPLK